MNKIDIEVGDLFVDMQYPHCRRMWIITGIDMSSRDARYTTYYLGTNGHINPYATQRSNAFNDSPYLHYKIKDNMRVTLST